VIGELLRDGLIKEISARNAVTFLSGAILEGSDTSGIRD
jgi:hypothetical protein